MRLQEFHDPGGHRIEFDAGDMENVVTRGRHQRRKEAAADAGFEHAAAAGAEPHDSRPYCSDDVFRREMGVLVCSARATRDDLGVDNALELSADSSQPFRYAASPGRWKTPFGQL